jgi:hypothetical protein
MDCTNSIRNVEIDIINSVLTGGILFRQKCVVDAHCLFDTSMTAIVDILQKARNSSAAHATGALNTETANARSRQELHERIVQAINQKCDITSLNTLDDVTINAVNSRIDGGIEISQEGQVQGTCAMKASFNALAAAQQDSSNSAQSGKDKKANKKGTLTMVLVLVIIFMLFSVAVAIYMKTRKQTPSA